MDSSACGHLSVHQPRSEQSEGQSTGAPRAQHPLSLGDITASQCRSHFKLISLCTMFFKSFLNKTEIQCLFPGVWEQRPGHMCALKKLRGERRALGVHFYSCLAHLLTSHPPPPHSSHPGTSGVWEGHCGKASLETGHRGPWPGTPAARFQGEKPEFNSIRIPGPARRPRPVLALLLQEIYA